MCIRDSGDITLTSLTEDKADLATINGFSDVILSSANITVTDNVDKAEADAINGYNGTSGIVTLTSITDTVSNVTAVENNANISLDTSTITVTDAASLVDATAIKDFTTAQVTLQKIEDTVSNITSIDGIDSNDVSMASASITVTDPASLADATAINGFTKGQVTLNSVQDGYDNLFAIINTSLSLIHI